MRNVTLGVLMLVMLGGLGAAQDKTLQQIDAVTTTGVVVSSTPSTLVVKSDDGVFHLFTFIKDTIKPKSITLGSTVRTISIAGEDVGSRIATSVTVLTEASKTEPVAPTTIPPSVQHLESDIKRQMRRFQGGFRGGVTLDPELIMIGAHAQMGPIFSPDLFFRPNVEFAWGEVTRMFSINPEIIYRIPVTSRVGKWSTYVGVGPGFNFLRRSFEDGEEDIDFGDFDTAIGLNILGGLRYRSGMFVELKASVYSEPAPTLRLIFGYNF